MAYLSTLKWSYSTCIRMKKKKKMTAYVTERKRVIITLWTFTVTVVPARPLSFCAAASLSTPSSLSPEVPKT